MSALPAFSIEMLYGAVDYLRSEFEKKEMLAERAESANVRGSKIARRDADSVFFAWLIVDWVGRSRLALAFFRLLFWRKIKRYRASCTS